ncbi:MAG TPA: amidase [Caulobacteraceae bacterium]|jgi:amidase|nr:amidase [Caulobacteraceae bacterium]
MNAEDYQSRDAIGLADLVARKEVSESEVLDAALDRLEQVNGTLNAVINVLEDEARGAIAEGLPDGPLRGVPFLLKDLGVWMKGVPTGSGSRLFQNAAPAAVDSALTAAYRAAGLVLFGKTNTPEFGMAATTEPAVTGATLNPWNLERTCGGSSGGAASAVAAGVLPAAHASDGGGSIRIPASCCGLFGLKPSRGRVSPAPLGDSWNGFAVNHAVTRTVRDSALLLDISCRLVAEEPYGLEPPSAPFLNEVGRDPGKLRIGYVRGALMAPGIEAPVARAMSDAAHLCESLGHGVEETTIPADFAAMREAANDLVSASAALMFERIGKQRGRSITEDEVESVPWIVAQRGAAISAIEAMDCFQTLYDFSRIVARTLANYDVLLISTLGRLPPPVGELSTVAVDPDAYPDALYAFMPNTQPFNVSGATAMSVPLGWSDEGLPIGVQFVAKRGAEAVLLRLAGQLEAAQPWIQRRPDEHGWARG